ncbi:terminase large subunit [Acidobacteria bacterium AH-259-A15]|nr:terminase large subunit [Acidobacteria bacterium AH-259-A15]
MTTKKSKKIQGNDLAPTLGPRLCKWVERYLAHAEGDFYGRPFRFADYQREFIWRAYELQPDGSRKYNEALLGVGKGAGKTELAAVFACLELAGPVVFDGWKKNGRPEGVERLSPDIPMAATSFLQADEVFTAASTMIEQSRLSRLCEVYETEIRLKGRPGRIYRVAGSPESNDGKKPTFLVADELHEWEGRRARNHLVLANGLTKRRDAWQLNITTAGWNLESLLGRLYKRGKRIQKGKEPENGFLFAWYGADTELDISKKKQLKKAIRQAHPELGQFGSIERIMDRIQKIPENEGRRYYLNQWFGKQETWEAARLWPECQVLDRIPDEVPIALGFDGSFSGDSTALVGCTIEEIPHLFVVDAWESDNTADWHVDVPDVEQAIRDLCVERDVRIIGCDPFRWQRSLSILENEGLPIVSWPSHTPSRMAPACQAFLRAVKSGGVTHDGDPRAEQHIGNCEIKTDRFGPRIVKDDKDSPRRIDIAVALVIAHDLAIRQLTGEGQSTWGPADAPDDENRQRREEPMDDFMPIGAMQ